MQWCDAPLMLQEKQLHSLFGIYPRLITVWLEMVRWQLQMTVECFVSQRNQRVWTKSGQSLGKFFGVFRDSLHSWHLSSTPPVISQKTCRCNTYDSELVIGQLGDADWLSMTRHEGKFNTHKPVSLEIRAAAWLKATSWRVGFYRRSIARGAKWSSPSFPGFGSVNKQPDTCGEAEDTGRSAALAAESLHIHQVASCRIEVPFRIVSRAFCILSSF